jgi:hypothetical protein
MRKGVTSSTVIVVGAIIILFFTAYVVWGFISGQQFKKPQVDSPTTNNPKGTCTIDAHCTSNPSGSICKKFSEPQFPERIYSFCGCKLNEDCQSTTDVVRSGVCGQDNKCE